MEDAQEYIAAVRRDRRDRASAEWQTTLGSIDGVQIVTESRSERLRIKATPEALEEAKRRLGDILHIERLIEHETIDLR